MKPATKTKTPIHPTLTSAAKTMGVEIEILRFAKAQGCPAFNRDGSVDERAFTDWLIDKEPEIRRKSGSLSLRERKGLEEITRICEDTRRLRIANDAAERELVNARDVLQVFARFTGMRESYLQQKLEDELPAEIQGLDIHDIRVKARTVYDEIRAADARFLEEIQRDYTPKTKPETTKE